VKTEEENDNQAVEYRKEKVKENIKNQVVHDIE
jgi:hypothetical protein